VRLKSVGPARLDILVENTGRLNSTKNMRNEWKGIESALLSGKPLTNWRIYSLPMQTQPEEVEDAAPYGDAGGNGPHYAAASFQLERTGDAFLDVSALGKGVFWVNGRCLGRFWNVGPQRTLFVPKPWLNRGANTVVVFDMFAGARGVKLVGRMKPILDGPTPGYADDPERKKKAAADAEFGPKLDVPGAKAPKE
jgi:beta-galactosidase